MEKQVTVLMSTYNGEQYIRQQVDSILRQRDIHLQLIVRDDGSTDQTISILEEYQQRGQLKYYRGSNLRTAKSFLQLVKDSPETDYYAFSDQDDVWDEHKLSRAISLLTTSRVDNSIPLLYAGSFQMTDRDLRLIPGGENHYTTQTFANAIVYSCCTGCTMVMNRCLRDLIHDQGLPQHMLMHDDWIHKVCLAMGGQVIFDPQPMMFYRQHGDNVDGGIHTLKDKIQKVLHDKRTLSRIMSNQLTELKMMYGEHLPKQNQELLNHALSFGCGNLFQRISLAFDPTYKIRDHYSLNHEFRISLLMNYW